MPELPIASQPDQPRIAPAAPEDLPSIARLAAAIWHACYPDIITTEQIDYMLQRMYAVETMRAELQRGIRYDRLLLGDEAVAFSSYGPAEPPEVFKLHKLYLHPKWHGRGWGSLLLRHCEQEVRASGAHRLVLSVNKRNAKAIAAYRRNGFEVTDSVVTDIGGGFVMDDYVMAKELDESPWAA